MDTAEKLRTVYNFRNTCHNCFNDIDFPLLGNFVEGETMFQTEDGKDFYIAVLVGNHTLDLIENNLKQNEHISNKEIFSQKVLALLADKVNDKEFTTDYPICPMCKARQRRYEDSMRTKTIEIGYASWVDFERLSQDSKIERIIKAVHSLTQKTNAE